MADYVPVPLAKFKDWVRLQPRKRPLYATELGWSPADLTRMDAADARVLQAFQEEEDAQTTAAKKTEERQELVKTYLKERRAEVAHAKTQPNYTAAIGKDLEWLNPEGDVNRDALKPTLKIVRCADGWKLIWSKEGQDGVKVFRRQRGQTAWLYLATDMRSPYIDTEEGLVGEYEYYVHLLHDDQLVGQPSDIVTAVHGGR